MATATPPPAEPPTDTSPLAELQGQYTALIHQYVRRRVPDPRQPERVVREVFQTASVNPAQVQARRLSGIGTCRTSWPQDRSADQW